ncbi:hypothetical protein O6H91_04G019900 [Diphasiastrum complanatum]|uniref:Uncharacterized protein n=1 Tax=Diphasiastrum complanatum TaxID=34168 RepID=A0ACC2DUM7_DIPCM|nr:hypothetical protein O6H91_04G019900 [Diphasiastrum complanatum]
MDLNKILDERILEMPGFRFHPTDHELLDFYLRKMVEGKLQPGGFIRSVELCSYDPWELPGLASTVGEKEWFFFVPRVSRKPHITRPTRLTPSGFWKATGTERTVKTLSGKCLGRKKTLVFYKGRAPKGARTKWVMQEYRLAERETSDPSRESQLNVALCRVYTKASSAVFEACQQKASRQIKLEDFSDSAADPPLCSTDNATTFRRNLLSVPNELRTETSKAAYNFLQEAEPKGEQTLSNSLIQPGSFEDAASIDAKARHKHSLSVASQSEKFTLNSTTSQQITAQEREGSESFWDFCADEEHDFYMCDWDAPLDLDILCHPEFSSSADSNLSYMLATDVPDLFNAFHEV